MTITSDQRAALDRYTIEDLRQQLRYAGPGPGAVVLGLADNMISRADIQAYIFEREQNERASRLEQEQKAAQTQRRLPRVSILVAVIGIIVSAALTSLIFVWTNRALLSPTAAGIRGGIDIDQPFSYFVSYGNIGKGPAYGFAAQEDIGTVEAPEPQASWYTVFPKNTLKDVCKRTSASDDAGVIYPSGPRDHRYTATASPEEFKITPEILNGAKIIFVHGCFAYKTFILERKSEYCFLFSPRDNFSALRCPYGNNVL